MYIKTEMPIEVAKAITVLSLLSQTEDEKRNKQAYDALVQLQTWANTYFIKQL